ncbi:hypothetical protein PTKIN_Ptkin01aG0060700 [Pterospermum kingtungense]
MKHEEVLRPDWKEPALFLTSSLCLGTMWFSILQLKMEMKLHPQEDQSQTTLKLASVVWYVLGLGYCFPVTILFGVVWFSYFFGCPKHQLINISTSECKETKFPVWFTGLACILCWISVPLLWRLLNDDWERVLRQPQLHLLLVEVHIARFSLGFTTSLVLAISFTLCTLQEICKKYLETAKIFPISDVESVHQLKS